MSMNISDIYRPVTAAPFRDSDGYREYAPCKELAPYIRCFWSVEGGGQPSLVIPDTCTDIIFDVRGSAGGTYCGINDMPTLPSLHTSPSREMQEKRSSFAVRFYCHTAMLFSGGSMGDTLNRYIPAEELFGRLSMELASRIAEAKDTAERIKISEHLLLTYLDGSRENTAFLNGLYYIITGRGSVKVSDISAYTAYSKRQLERIFKSAAGVSPKTLTELVRYQLLWQEILSGKYVPGEAVGKFGYCDQAHMLNDFKKFHGVSPEKAVNYARSLK
ncbi:MAG: helix-turn-helix domain-containing protein [Ruminococcus sp.]|nr:helix-turn-helix domain-containing protein [Ruminococcus sp.]